MNKITNAKLTGTAKALRKNMTREEKHLWYDFLKKLAITVHRQKVIGIYIVDFYCAQSKLVIELDGSQHYEVKGKQADAVRDGHLKSLGIEVVRYSNLDVNHHFDAVCQDILKKLLLKEKADTFCFEHNEKQDCKNMGQAVFLAPKGKYNVKKI